MLSQWPGADDVQHFIHKLEGASALPAVWDILTELAETYDLRCLCYHQVDFFTKDQAAKKIIMDDLNGAKDHDALSKKARVRDPVNQAAMQSAEPFSWDQIKDLVVLSDIQRVFLKTVFSNLEQTITVPVFGPAGRNGYFCFEATHLTEFKQMYPICNAVLQLAHKKICLFAPAETGVLQNLTARERDVLQLLAYGKSNATIATILNISRHTVDTYIRRIYEKLDVSDRVSAAVKAQGSGLIS